MNTRVAHLLAPCLLMLATLAAALETTATDSYRLVRHDLGETRAPLKPQRLVTLFPGHADAALALGAEVAGIGVYFGASNAYLEAFLEDATEVGSSDGSNLEAILALAPDLILAPTELVAETYAQLSQIAPTVALTLAPAGEDRMRTQLLEVAQVLGREAEAEQVLADFDARVAAAREALSPAAQGARVAAIFLTPTGPILYPYALAPLLYRDLGLTPAQVVENNRDAEGPLPLSTEIVAELDATHLFIAANDPAFATATLATPPWSNLEAVQQARATIVDPAVWTANGPLGRRAQLGDIVAAFEGGAP
jgi:iron complex transport system substrate-binding protein